MTYDLKTLFPSLNTTIHIIGIGGIGMSGIAEILNNLGYKVQGSDAGSSAITKRLEQLGIKCFVGHDTNNISGATLVVKSSAITEANPEIMAARARNIPVIKRADMLAELMRFKISIAISGTHGKTTTTSLVAQLFEKAGLKPTVINGGIINQLGTNAYLGEGDYLIVEADESDGTFIKVPSNIAVITNIDPEHLDYYKSFENLKNAFRSFIENLPFYGFAVVCIDSANVQSVIGDITDRRVYRYSIHNADCDFWASNITAEPGGMKFDLNISQSTQSELKLNYNLIADINLSIFGRHNVSNSIAAIVIGIIKGFSPEIIRTALADFGGVKRRFTKTGEIDDILIIDDYAHHPEEIRATLSTARIIANTRQGRVIAIMQPHRFSRLQSLMSDFANCFTDADEVMIADVYPASEQPIPGVDAAALINHTRHNFAGKVDKLTSPDSLANEVLSRAKANDIVIFLGAGDITKWAYALPAQLEELKNA